jgi:hypothetical protein
MVCARKHVLCAARATIPAWLALASACIPTVAHGPRVAPGFAGGMSLSTNRSSTYEGATSPFVVGPFGINVGYGWAHGDSGAALRLGAAMLPIPPRFDPDIYVQVPRRALLGLDGGIGVAATTILSASVLTYAQLGSIHNATGLYVTGGYLHQSIPTDTIATPVRLRDDAWLATLAYQLPRGQHVSHYFITGIVGQRFPRRCSDAFYDCSTLRRPWSVMVGTTMELQANRLPQRRR